MGHSRNFGVRRMPERNQKKIDSKQAGMVIVVMSALALLVLGTGLALVQYIFGIDFGFRF